MTVEPQPSAAARAAAEASDAAGVVIAARAVTKSFGSREVVCGLDFDVAEGECVGFLGPNGAGKTTTIRMITCQSPLGGGEIRVFGLPVGPRHERAIKRRLGIVPQEENLDPDLSVLVNLLVYASYFDVPRAEAARRADELLQLFALADRRDARIDTLSGGMKRRLSIARALIHSPDLVVLDEPTTGLDPQARHLVWEKLRDLGRRGATMLLTTHYMEEAAQLCDRILIVDAGREVFEVFPPFDDALRERCVPHASRVEQTADALRLYLDGDRPAAPLFAALAGREFLHRAANLEDVFLRLTKRELRD